MIGPWSMMGVSAMTVRDFSLTMSSALVEDKLAMTREAFVQCILAPD